MVGGQVMKAASCAGLIAALCVAVCAWRGDTAIAQAADAMCVPVFADAENALTLTDLGCDGKRIAASILASPAIGARSSAARVLFDADYFQNESSARIADKAALIKTLAADVFAHAADKMRAPRRMTDEEFESFNAMAVKRGERAHLSPSEGADLRLAGRLTSATRMESSGAVVTAFKLLLELVDLETSDSAWTGTYEFAGPTR